MKKLHVIVDKIHLDVLFLIVAVFALLQLFSVELPTQLDFGQLYGSLQDVRSDGHLYQISDDQIALSHSQSSLIGPLPFPGPPWYVALVLPLGALSAETAAQLWLALSVGAPFAIIKILRPDLALRSRALFFLLLLISAPIQGHLIVGQFTLPAALGVAICALGLRRNSCRLIVFGLALATLRPHLGLPLTAALAAWLLIQHRSLGVRVVCSLLPITAILFALGYAVDPLSIRRYPEYLSLLNSFPSNKLCDTCSSIPIAAERLLSTTASHLWSIRFCASLVVGFLLSLPLLARKGNAEITLAAFTCVTMLAAPYIRNYDFVLLAIPGALMAAQPTSHRHRYFIIFISAATYMIAGVLPYFAPRHVQGELLWAAPALMYAACALTLGKTQQLHLSDKKPSD